MELGDENMVSVTYHGLLDATQGNKINALYTPTFCLSSPSTNRTPLDLQPRLAAANAPYHGHNHRQQSPVIVSMTST
jgi:hypothetical protein